MPTYFFIMWTDAERKMYIVDPVTMLFRGFRGKVGDVEATSPENAIEQLRKKFKHERVRIIEIYEDRYAYRNGKILAKWSFLHMHPRSINRIWHMAAQNAASR